jgi:hypothetical protein
MQRHTPILATAKEQAEPLRPLLVKEREQADLLRISWHHLVNLRRQRLIPYVKLGKKSIRYNPIEVERALKKLTVEEHTPALPARARR